MVHNPACTLVAHKYEASRAIDVKIPCGKERGGNLCGMDKKVVGPFALKTVLLTLRVRESSRGA
jgi:hypothetical protein